MSKLSDYFAGLDRVAPGWNKDRWNAALADTKACRDSVKDRPGAVDRMVGYIECRRNKKLPVKSA